jgi:hypothetical protein
MLREAKNNGPLKATAHIIRKKSLRLRIGEWTLSLFTEMPRAFILGTEFALVSVLGNSELMKRAGAVRPQLS